MWKSEGWIKPELIEDTNLDQVTLVMKMEKESDDKSAEKSAESAEKSADPKIMERMDLSERYQQILAIMEAGIEYSTKQVAESILSLWIENSSLIIANDNEYRIDHALWQG